MSIPFPQAEYTQPYAPLGLPFPSSSPGYTHIPSPSFGPGLDHHYRSRTRSHSSAQHHHRSRSDSRGHHDPSPSNYGHHHGHQHPSRSHSRTRTHSHSHRDQSHSHSHPHSHGRSHSHSRPRFPSATPAPPVLVTQHSDPYAAYATTQPQPYSHQYGPVQVQYGRSAPIAYPQPNPSAYAPQYPQPQVNVVQPRRIHFSHQQQTLLSHEINSTQAQAQAHHRRQHKHSLTHPLFHYSRCTGQRKAVCIGINYAGTGSELKGCVNDAKNMYRFLTEHHNYPKSSVVFLTDTSHDPRTHPTRANIINAMRWLVQDAHEDDALFLHYSGHGGQTHDLDGDETDGNDEVIFPLDYKTHGVITDDEMHKIMVKPLPPGCRLTGLFDSCHSGSILDLPYLYHSNGRVKGSQVSRRFKKERTTPADVITWSGSTDSQTSADTVQGGQAVGAMSYAFVKVLKRNPQISYQDLLRGVREVLKSKYSQKPQLSSSHRIDTNLRFVI